MHFSVLVFLCLSQLLRVCGDAEVVYKSTNLECKISPKYAANFTCVVKARDWNKAVLQMDVYLISTLRNVTAHFEAFKKGYNNRFHPFLVNSTVNMCDVLAKRNYSAYGMILWKVLKKYTNLNHSCPFSGYQFARDLHIESNNTYLPKLPLGFYLFSVNIYENFARGPSDPVSSFKYYFQAMEMVKIKQKQKFNKTN